MEKVMILPDEAACNIDRHFNEAISELSQNGYEITIKDVKVQDNSDPEKSGLKTGIMIYDLKRKEMSEEENPAKTKVEYISEERYTELEKDWMFRGIPMAFIFTKKDDFLCRALIKEIEKQDLPFNVYEIDIDNCPGAADEYYVYDPNDYEKNAEKLKSTSTIYERFPILVMNNGRAGSEREKEIRYFIPMLNKYKLSIVTNHL